MAREYNQRRRIAREHGGKYPEIIVDMFENGKHKVDIAQIFGITVNTVEYHLREKRKGYIFINKRKPLPESDIVEIHETDASQKFILDKFKISRQTYLDILAYKGKYGEILRKYGIKKKKQKKKEVDPGLEVIGERPCLGLNCNAMIPKILDRHRQKFYCGRCGYLRNRQQDEFNRIAR